MKSSTPSSREHMRLTYAAKESYLQPACKKTHIVIKTLMIVVLFLIPILTFGSGWMDWNNKGSVPLTNKNHQTIRIHLLQTENSGFATNRGSLMIGGNFSFRYRKGVDDYEDKSLLLEFEPQVSVFIMPSFSIGGTIIARYYKYGDYTPSTTWGVGPTLTYYIAGQTKKAIYPYLEGSFMITGNSHLITYSELEFGAMFMLSDAVGLTTSLKYRLDIHYPEGSQAEHVNNIIFGVGIRTFIIR